MTLSELRIMRLKDGLLQKIITHAGTLLSGSMVVALLQLAALALVARAIGTEGLGNLAFGMAYAKVIDSLVNFQSWQALIKYGSDILENNRQRDFPALIKTGFLLDTATAVIGAVVAVTGALLLYLTGVFGGQTALVAGGFGAGILFNINGTPTAVLRLFNRYKLMVSVRVAVSCVYLLASVAGFFWVPSLWFFLAVTLLCNVARAQGLLVASFHVLRRQGFPNVLQESHSGVRKRFPGLFRFFITTNLSTSIQLASGELDVLIVGGVAGPHATGLYKLAKQLAAGLGMIADPVQQVAYPEIARLWSVGNHRQFARVMMQTGLLMAAIGVTLALGFAAFGEQMIRIIAGPEFIAAYPLCLVLICSYVIFLMGVCFRPAMLSMGRARHILTIYIASSIVYFTILITLVQSQGAMAAPLARFAFMLLWFCTMLVSIIIYLKRSIQTVKPDATYRGVVLMMGSETIGPLLARRLYVGMNRAFRHMAGLLGMAKPKECLPRVHKYRAKDSQTFFGYYDLSPFNASNTRILAVSAPVGNHPPLKGDEAAVGYFNWPGDGTFNRFGETTTWCWQQSCRLQWWPGDPDQLAVYNRLVDGRYGAVVQNVETGKIIRQFSSPLYQVSPDGKKGLSLNFSRLNRLRPGYGYVDLEDTSINDPCPDNDGVWVVDLINNKAKLIFSLSFLRQFEHQLSMTKAEHYVNHLAFNPSGSIFCFLHLWQTADGKRQSRLLASDCYGRRLHVVVKSRIVSHFIWQSDEQLIVYSHKETTGAAYYVYNERSKEFNTLHPDQLKEDGHPSFSCKGDMITDTYPDKFGEQSLLLVNRIGDVQKVDSLYSPPQFTGEIRCDLHPRWDRSGHFVCLDSAQDGKRALSVIEVSHLTSTGGLQLPFDGQQILSTDNGD